MLATEATKDGSICRGGRRGGGRGGGGGGRTKIERVTFKLKAQNAKSQVETSEQSVPQISVLCHFYYFTTKWHMVITK